MQTNCIFIASVIYPQILIFSVFKMSSCSPYWLQFMFSMSLFFYLFTHRGIKIGVLKMQFVCIFFNICWITAFCVYVFLSLSQYHVDCWQTLQWRLLSWISGGTNWSQKWTETLKVATFFQTQCMYCMSSIWCLKHNYSPWKYFWSPWNFLFQLVYEAWTSNQWA